MARTKAIHPAHRRPTTRHATPTLILLVRHGQTPTTGKLLPGRAAGLHLAESGKAQAQCVADRIAQLKSVDAIYSSPLERARETAAPIAAGRSLKVRIDKGLLECDFGGWTGGELKSLMKLPEWNNVQRAPSTFTFPGGESFTAMQNRIIGTIDRLRTA
ncbi:MAG: histidine phosphatase family protein, partial [Actinobacteria bacterium]|nr:histidine phosphatase family protein [Actinomycetota bacterium]